MFGTVSISGYGSTVTLAAAKPQGLQDVRDQAGRGPGDAGGATGAAVSVLEAGCGPAASVDLHGEHFGAAVVAGRVEVLALL